MRTMLLADIHAFPNLIFNALEAEERRTGEPIERIVFLGDYIDIGPDPLAVLDFIENDKRVKDVLCGNHDGAIIAQQRISPQSPESWHLRGRLINDVTQKNWKLATEVDGVLLTHAGVGVHYQTHFDKLGLKKFIDFLNDQFRRDVHGVLDTLDGKMYATVSVFNDEFGPLWFRPMPTGGVLQGVQQVAGHTPGDYYSQQNEKAIRKQGLRLIDPYSRETGEQGGRYKYGIILDGSVRVYSGVL
jgi:hypothetical protein